MTHHCNHPDPEPLFFIARSNDDPVTVVHHGELLTANTMQTGQAIVEEFTIAEYGTAEAAEAAYWARLAEFGIYPDPDPEEEILMP